MSGPFDYAAHLDSVARQWSAACERHGFDAVVVLAGTPRDYFLDDHGPRFQPNPHFNHWLPGDDWADSVLVVAPGCATRLAFCRPEDFWHAPPSLPSFVETAFDVVSAATPEAVRTMAAGSLDGIRRWALIGEQAPAAPSGGVVNPPGLLADLHYARACKDPWEVEQIRRATRASVRGHRAAERSFRGGGSEYDVHMAYLTASGQTERDLPYGNIVALNSHAGTLHYQHQERDAPARHLSLLIDAGARCSSYACDITRTYGATDGAGGDEFRALIAAMDELQQRIVASIRPGDSYVDLHVSAHRRLAAVLAEAGLVTGSAEAAFEQGITEAFLPHGLGHLLGLQVHDVGGHLADRDGNERPPPERYPALRLTRPIEPGQVFTIEPGLYFVPMLLEELEASKAGRDVDWRRVEQLAPCGGIRIEDDVVVLGDGVDNITRAAFGELER